MKFMLKQLLFLSFLLLVQNKVALGVEDSHELTADSSTTPNTPVSTSVPSDTLTTTAAAPTSVGTTTTESTSHEITESSTSETLSTQNTTTVPSTTTASSGYHTTEYPDYSLYGRRGIRLAGPKQTTKPTINYQMKLPTNSSLVPIYGSSILNIYDTDSTKSIQLDKEFTFLGNTYSTAYVSANGLITFEKGVGYDTYGCKANTFDVPAIAAFRTDSQSRRSSYSGWSHYSSYSTYDTPTVKLFYKQDVNSLAFQKVSKDVKLAFPELAHITLNWMLVVTWYNVAYKSYTSTTNTFQTILASDGEHSFVLFYYDKINWPSKTVGINPAVAGVFGGKQNYNKTYIVPGSCTYALSHITEMSNIDISGKFVFRVDTNVETPLVSKFRQLMEKQKNESNYVPRIHFTPYFVPALGMAQLYVHGLTSLCLKHPVKNITCVFSTEGELEVETNGQTILGNLAVLCVKPDLSFQGKVDVTVTVLFDSDEKVTVRGHIYVQQNATKLIDLRLQNSQLSRNVIAEAGWNPKEIGFTELQQMSAVLPASINLTELVVNAHIAQLYNSLLPSYFSISLLELNGNKWRSVYSFSTNNNVPNNGSFVAEIPWNIGKTMLAYDNGETVLHAMAVVNSLKLDNGDKLFTEQISDVLPTTFEVAKMQILNQGRKNGSHLKCQRWHETEPDPPTDVLSCPYVLEQAELDWRFQISKQSAKDKMLTNSQNVTVYLQSIPSKSGAGSMCVYNQNGSLVLQSPHGSRTNLHSPNNKRNIWDHYKRDVLPYFDCCVLSSNTTKYCQHFFAKRTLLKNLLYKFPKPFSVTGASQVTSIDGRASVINLSGEYWLLKLGKKFGLQILVEPYSGSSESIQKGNYITKAVFTNPKIRVISHSSLGLLVWLDEEPLNFFRNELTDEIGFLNQDFQVNEDDVAIVFRGNTEATFSFLNGIALRFSTTAGNRSLNIVGTVSKEIWNEIGGIVAPSKVQNINEKDWHVDTKESNLAFSFDHSYSTMDKQSVSQTEDLPTDYYHAVCNSSAKCLTDYGLTHDMEFALSSYKTNKMFDRLTNMALLNISQPECGEPAKLENGNFNGTSYQFGSTITYFCKHGYLISAKTKNTQETSKHFTITCFSNELLSSSKGQATWVSLNSNLPLDKIELSCETGQTNANYQAKYEMTKISECSGTIWESLWHLSIIVLWVVVGMLIYVIYKQRRWSPQEKVDISQMHLMSNSHMETI